MRRSQYLPSLGRHKRLLSPSDSPSKGILLGKSGPQRSPKKSNPQPIAESPTMARIIMNIGSPRLSVWWPSRDCLIRQLCLHENRRGPTRIATRRMGSPSNWRLPRARQSNRNGASPFLAQTAITKQTALHKVLRSHVAPLSLGDPIRDESVDFVRRFGVAIGNEHQLFAIRRELGKRIEPASKSHTL